MAGVFNRQDGNGRGAQLAQRREEDKGVKLGFETDRSVMLARGERR
jgi:hypothetical protein